MKDVSIRDMMIPLAEYATVAEDASLYEAILALEEAQAGSNAARYRHRAVLVYDKNGHIVGKLSQMDVIKALEPNYADRLGEGKLSRFGISADFIESILDDHDCWSLPLEELCAAASRQRVSDIMYTPTEGEFVKSDASLREAVHRLVIGHHHSLLVTDGHAIVGVLRLSDVFAAVCDIMTKKSGDRPDSAER
jgi:CBS domain-containing protein